MLEEGVKNTFIVIVYEITPRLKKAPHNCMIKPSFYLLIPLYVVTT